MSYVQSVVGVRPIPRYDNVAWTEVEWRESDARDGVYALIDTQPLANPDPDPSQPATRNLTTTQAQLSAGWYQLTFKDPGGNSDVVDPIPAGVSGDTTLPPSPDAIREDSRLVAELLPATPENDRLLRGLVVDSIALVSSLTYRRIDPAIPCPADIPCEDVPASLVPLAYRAVALMTERLLVTGEPKFAQQVATGRRLRGFSAGPYSESYFAPGEFARRGAQQGRPPMDPDEQLDGVLWALATEAAREAFVAWATGVQPPAGAVSAFNTNRRGNAGVRRLYGPDGY